jgi:hypothetical protein
MFRTFCSARIFITAFTRARQPVPILSQINSNQFMITFNTVLPSAVMFPELFYTYRRSGVKSDANVGEELCKFEKERTWRSMWQFCDTVVPVAYDPVPSFPPHTKGGVHFAVAVALKRTVSSQFHVHRCCWFGQRFLFCILTYFPPAQFNHENWGSMLFRNSGMHMQNTVMLHGQLSVVTTLRTGRSWVRILAGPRYFYIFNV